MTPPPLIRRERNQRASNWTGGCTLTAQVYSSHRVQVYPTVHEPAPAGNCLLSLEVFGDVVLHYHRGCDGGIARDGWNPDIAAHRAPCECSSRDILLLCRVSNQLRTEPLSNSRRGIDTHSSDSKPPRKPPKRGESKNMVISVQYPGTSPSL